MPPGRPHCGVAFDDSPIVRNATPIEGFRDAEFDYQLVRALGVAAYGGSTVGECLAAAAEIADGSPRSWSRAFGTLAGRVEEEGRACLGGGHHVSGRDHLLRASTYYRTAEYYTPGADGAHFGDRSRACFVDAAAHVAPPVEVVEIPFGTGALPGYLVASGAPGAPTLVAVGGFDSSAEELYFHYAVPGAERGWNVLVVDGPGQPGCLRRYPDLTFRPDYEAPVGAVLDHLAGRDGIDRDRIALVGQSFGGYFAARAAAAHPVAALVVDPPVVDLRRYMEAWVGPEVFHMANDVRPEDVAGVPEDLMPRQMQWGIEAICRRFGVASFHAWRDALSAYVLGDAASRIACPVLALVGEREGPEPLAQFQAFVDMLPGGATTHRFTVAEGVSAHCQADNVRRSAQVIFDWLDNRLG